MTGASAFDPFALAKTLSGVAERLKAELAVLDEAGHHMGAACLSRAIDVIEADRDAIVRQQS